MDQANLLVRLIDALNENGVRYCVIGGQGVNADFVDRATVREVLGLPLPVAAVEDVLRGKVWAASDATRRGSQRQKDLADIARLIEAYPNLTALVPPDILDRLV